MHRNVTPDDRGNNRIPSRKERVRAQYKEIWAELDGPDTRTQEERDEQRVMARRGAPRVAKSKTGRGNDRDIRAWLLDYKRRSPCVDCGEQDVAVLDFHHRDPSIKRFNLSNHRGRELQEIEDEVSKCDVLCANCHRRRHNDGRRF